MKMSTPSHWLINFAVNIVPILLYRLTPSELVIMTLLPSLAQLTMLPDVFKLRFLFPAAPGAVQDLDILPSLSLVWSRPSVPPFTQLQVPTNYTIEINATDQDGMNFINFTSDTSLSVQFLEDMLRDLGSECVEFEFFVSATNDAGTGPSVRVLDTVPICKLLRPLSNY